MDCALVLRGKPESNRCILARPRRWKQGIRVAQDQKRGKLKVPCRAHLRVGGKPLDVSEEDSPAHHTPEFYVDDRGMKLGVRLLTNLTVDYMAQYER